ncbi:MAG: guanylate kinase, partial [Lachnospiraceae bacterium]|nr:guanylate kinase [Lachnospiraceae bacterium]
DEALDLYERDYLATGSLGAYLATRDYFVKDKVVPIYIEVDDGIRLKRALERELKPENRRFKEMCRRFLADDEDYQEEKLADAGMEKRFVNDVFFDCVEEITDYIRKKREADGYQG